jgi:ketosteroid isomerase-like protein
MMGRSEIDRLMREFYAARMRGDLEEVCRSFLADAQFKIASASKVRQVAIRANGVEEIRPLMALLLKTFRLSDFAILAMTIEGAEVTVHWQANVRSKITGATVPTELADIVKLRDGFIADFYEIYMRG